jgi:hypothetical protein
MRIYINGLEATDHWRTVGAGSLPNLQPVGDAWIGARTLESHDPRNFDGVVDFVKAAAGAWSSPSTRNPACRGKLDLEFKILGHGACTDTAFIAALLAGDSIEIEIAKNEDFTDGLIRVVVSSANAELAAEKLADLVGYKGVIFWLGRILHAKDMAMAKTTAASEEEWSLSRPLVVDMSGDPIAIRSPSKAILIPGRAGTFIAASADSPEPSLYDLAGKCLGARFRKVPGGWELEPTGRGLAGLFFIAR